MRDMESISEIDYFFGLYEMARKGTIPDINMLEAYEQTKKKFESALKIQELMEKRIVELETEQFTFCDCSCEAYMQRDLQSMIDEAKK